MPMRRHNLPGEEEPQVFYYKPGLSQQVSAV